MPTRDIELYVYTEGFCHASVCVLAEASRKSIESRMNADHPPGGTLKWRISPSPTFKGGEPNPNACNLEPEKRKHYLMEC